MKRTKASIAKMLKTRAMNKAVKAGDTTPPFLSQPVPISPEEASSRGYIRGLKDALRILAGRE